MKQYVLDEPAPEPAAPAVEAGLPPRRRWPWRALLLLAVVEPLALGALYLALSADAGPVARSAQGEATTYGGFEPMPPARQREVAAALVDEARPEASRIAFERGRYVIDLRAADVAPALAMLAQATRATVHGGDVLLRDATRLSRTAVAATPAEAWQAVFGDVASFAVSCTPRGCAVWVAALAGKAATASPTAMAGAAAVAPAAAGDDVTASEDDPSSPAVAKATVAARVAAPAAEPNATGGAATEN